MAYRVAAFGAIMLLAGAASAHEFWLLPDKSRASTDEDVLVTIAVGQNFVGNSIPYIPDTTVRFDIYGPGGTMTDAARGFAKDPGGIVRPRRPGLYTVVYQNKGNTIVIDPEIFNFYLKNEGLDEALEYRKAHGLMDTPGREFYTRFPKTWVMSGDNINAGRWALAPSNLKFEMVPLSNPFTWRPGDAVDVRVLYEGKPIEGILVGTFTKSSDGRIEAVRSDRNGVATLHIDRAGRWLAAAVHLIPAPERPDEDWQSFWTSFTIDIPEK